MNLYIKRSFILLAMAFLLFQCEKSTAPEEDEHGHEEEAHGDHEEENEGTVSLSAIQVANAELEYGYIDTLNISDFVKANGILDLPPQNIAAVSAPMDGFVRKANFLVGDYVKKGTVLAVLEHMNYLKLQEEYLNVVNDLKYLKADYHRQKKLDSAKVTSERQFQEATAAYKSAEARKNALEKQLQYMGLSPQRVAQGDISSSISIRAPFSGYITALNVHNGAFAKSEQELYEIVDTEHMHVELNIFEQEISKIKVGQPIRFKISSIGEKSYKGEVFLVGKSFDQESKTVKVHGHIDGEHDEFIRGLYVDAKIYTGNQQVLALPEEAIVEDEGKSYIFILAENDAHGKEGHASDEKHTDTEAHGHEHDEHDEHKDDGMHEETTGSAFKRVQVLTGEKDQGFVQIKEVPELSATTKIVTQGAYYLLSEMKKGEGGHHHH